MRELAEILSLYDSRRAGRGSLLEKAREIKSYYEGDIVVPLPEISKKEIAPVVNLFTLAIDQQGMRIASTVPDVRFTPVRPSFKGSEELARQRRAAVMGWWEQTEMEIKLARRARWLTAYAASPVVIRPDFDRGTPTWKLRDPLGTYPSSEDYDEMTPNDVIFAFTRTFAWLKARRPEAFDALRKRRDTKPTDHVTLLEYVDGEETVLAVVGARRSASTRFVWSGEGTAATPVIADIDEHNIVGSAEIVELLRIPNKAGICPAVVPGRINLGRPMGQFDQMIGMFEMQAKLMALEVNAVMRGVYPNTWFIHGESGGDIITVADGIRGKIGEVKGGTIEVITENPAYMTPQIIDRLERNMRVQGPVPPEYGGESGSNIRTGRRGELVFSATVDFHIQEAQRLLARSLYHENVRAIAFAKSYFGPRQVSFAVQTKGSKGPLTYKANDIFENDIHVVRYAFPGTDLNGQSIRIAQKVGVGLMSKQTARELDPEVEQPEQERDRTTAEGLELALLSGIQAQAQQGAIPAVDVARIMQLVLTDKMELPEAVQKAQEEAQERQATEVPPGSPETQPGLGLPGAGAEQPATIPETPPSIDNLEGLLLSLARPQATARRISQEGV